jgi:pimeloyl-ACP methyl ester carboxylesterase
VAAHYPERVDRLILVDPAVIPYPMTTIGRIYQFPFIGEFMNAIPGDALMKNNIRTIWFYDKNKATDEYCAEVLQPLCIKGSYAGTMFILRNVLKEPYVEKEANLLAKMSIPTLIIHGREDKAIPLSRSKRLNDLWKGSKLVIFEKAGHTHDWDQLLCFIGSDPNNFFDFGAEIEQLFLIEGSKLKIKEIPVNVKYQQLNRPSKRTQ